MSSLINALQWEAPNHSNNYTWIARCPFGLFCIHIDGGRHMAWIEGNSDAGLKQWDGPEVGTLTEAKHSADAHYADLMKSYVDVVSYQLALTALEGWTSWAEGCTPDEISNGHKNQIERLEADVKRLTNLLRIANQHVRGNGE